MACAESLLPDRQRALVELFRLPVLALVSINVGQVVEALAHVAGWLAPSAFSRIAKARL